MSSSQNSVVRLGGTSHTVSRRKMRLRELREKESGFVLDCLNKEQAKLKVYNSASDKYLNYFVVRIHPNLNKPKRTSPTHKLELIEKVNHQRFQDMLKQYHERVEVRSALTSVVTLQSHVPGKQVGKSLWGSQGQQQKENSLVTKIQKSIRYRKRQKTIEEQSFVVDQS